MRREGRFITLIIKGDTISMNTNTRSFRTLLPAFAITALALSACGQGQPAQPAQPTVAPTATAQSVASQPPVIDIMAQDFAFAMPKQVPAGLVTLNFMNHGKEFHFATISRSAKLDMSNEDIVKALEAGAQTQQAPDWIDLSQGAYISTLDPDRSVQLTARLEPGRYVVLCFAFSADGVPHAVKGMFSTFDVVENTDAAQIAEPEADLVVTLKPDGVDFPSEVKAGKQTWKIVNDSGNPAVGNIYLAQLLVGKTRADLERCVMDPTCQPGNSPANALGGGGSPAGSAWLTLDLKPGEGYWLGTDIPDPTAPKPEGDAPPKTLMVEFTVK
jgi:methionine-rich copper-binding protein CopC